MQLLNFSLNTPARHSSFNLCRKFLNSSYLGTTDGLQKLGNTLYVGKNHSNRQWVSQKYREAPKSYSDPNNSGEKNPALDNSSSMDESLLLKDAQENGLPINKRPRWVMPLIFSCIASISNFLFGYHVGIMNGPLDSISVELGFSGSTLVQGMVISVFLFGACLGSLAGGHLADTFGRKLNFQLDCIPLILGSIICATSSSVLQFQFGRFLIGLGVGASAGFVPLYISEIAPTEIRGAMGCLCQLIGCIGIIAGLVIGIPAEANPHWWRVMFWIATIPVIVMAVGMRFSTESPRWLIKVGRWEEAEKSMLRLYDAKYAQLELIVLREADYFHSKQANVGWIDLLSPKYISVTLISMTLFILQQFSGINGVLFFSSSLFGNVGISNRMLASAAVGVANLLGSIIVVALMANNGRKSLLMGSYSGMASFMALLVISLTIPMPEALSHNLSLFAVLGYTFMFALGAGPVTAVVIPELCDTASRAKIMSTSLFTHWTCNFTIGLFFLNFVQRFGATTMYMWFGIVSAIAVVFTKLMVTETAGKSLEGMELKVNKEEWEPEVDAEK